MPSGSVADSAYPHSNHATQGQPKSSMDRRRWNYWLNEIAGGVGGDPKPVWCPRSESNRHAFKGGGFSCRFGFRRPACIARVRGLEHAVTMANEALGARRLLSTPSFALRGKGLARH